MKYVDEFRNARLVHKIAAKISTLNPGDTLNIMEVCGTHTQNFCRFGLAKLLPENIRLISGPGCPVCVSPQGYIDAAIKLAKNNDLLIITFGDMLRVPGSSSTLEKERARLGNVRVAYSPLEALAVARANPDKKVVFLAVGFETTAPTIALSILEARKENLKNLFFLSSLKLIPAAMQYLLLDKRLKVSGFLCPGHVSAVIGTKDYAFIPKKYKIPCCVTGFEPVDILEGIYMILKQIVTGRAYVANQYMRIVAPAGNLRAKAIIRQVFQVSDANWRGLGIIPGSGLELKNRFSGFDAGRMFSVAGLQNKTEPIKRCRCSEVLKGLISPPDCRLFGQSCRPDNPLGPCMVSGEGACNAYYKFRP